MGELGCVAVPRASALRQVGQNLHPASLFLVALRCRAPALRARVGLLRWLKTWSSSFGRRASRASCRPRSPRSRTCATASRSRRRSCSSCAGAWRRGSTQRICSRRSSGCPARCTRQYGHLFTPTLHPHLCTRLCNPHLCTRFSLTSLPERVAAGGRPVTAAPPRRFPPTEPSFLSSSSPVPNAHLLPPPPCSRRSSSVGVCRPSATCCFSRRASRPSGAHRCLLIRALALINTATRRTRCALGSRSA